MSWTRTLALLVSPAIVAASSSGGVLVVAPSGAPYAEIQAAVDASSDGDVVLVRDGTYASFAVRNVELAIVADANAIVNVDGAIRVSGVGATRTVVLSGLRATGVLGPPSSSRHGLIARNCAGSLRVLDCELRGTAVPANVAACSEGQGAWIENCADVLFRGCTLHGTDGSSTSFYDGFSDGGNGAFVDSSMLAVYDSTLRGGLAGLGYEMTEGCYPPPNPQPHSFWGASGEGLRAQGGFAFASNCRIEGARGRDGHCDLICDCPSAGGNALVHNGGAANVILLSNLLVPGVGGDTIPVLCCRFTCHNCINACQGAVAPTGNALVGSATTLPGSSFVLTATRVAREGQSMSVSVRGSPGSLVELVIDDVGAREGLRYEPALQGVWFQRPGRSPRAVLRMGTIGSGGQLTSTWLVPELGAGVEARSFCVQAIVTSAGGNPTLSSPATMLLVDAAL